MPEFKNPKECAHDRTISLNGKTSDLCYTEVPHLNYDKDGYVPSIKGLGGGDYISIMVCLDCGTVLGLEPTTDDELKTALDIEDDGDDDES